ncbi:hypothetical protein ACFPTY_17815 [Halomonas beimenensis]|uniref:Lipoprotein n=1 Tax=Halomonas beimenensis TaxID=475662 RepID=A0A291P2H8_9GAMM|nr:hypothetical protein [Halomonas beimenensis]ATJ81082.1 hypothetical protein BEI_0095 [Halomonas beimenensis]
MRPLRVATLAFALLLAGCAAGAPERPDRVRQALFGLGQRAATEVAGAPMLARPATDQVLLLTRPEVEADLGIAQDRLLESLTRALLALAEGPQVLDWQAALSRGAEPNQWRLDSRLVAAGPRLTLSDRTLVPYRLQLILRRPGSETALWQGRIDGALDATAL